MKDFVVVFFYWIVYPHCSIPLNLSCFQSLFKFSIWFVSPLVPIAPSSAFQATCCFLPFPLVSLSIPITSLYGVSLLHKCRNCVLTAGVQNVQLGACCCCVKYTKGKINTVLPLHLGFLSKG